MLRRGEIWEINRGPATLLVTGSLHAGNAQSEPGPTVPQVRARGPGGQQQGLRTAYTRPSPQHIRYRGLRSGVHARILAPARAAALHLVAARWRLTARVYAAVSVSAGGARRVNRVPAGAERERVARRVARRTAGRARRRGDRPRVPWRDGSHMQRPRLARRDRARLKQAMAARVGGAAGGVRVLCMPWRLKEVVAIVI